MDAEWDILYDKFEKIHHSRARVFLSKLPIDDVATQYFANGDVFCAGRVREEDDVGLRLLHPDQCESSGSRCAGPLPGFQRDPDWRRKVQFLQGLPQG